MLYPSLQSADILQTYMTVLPHPAIRTPTIVEPVCILTKSAILTRVRSAFVNIWNCIKTKHTSLSRRNRLGHYTDRSIDKPVLTEFTVLSLPAIRAFTGVWAIDVVADTAPLTRESRTLVHIWQKITRISKLLMNEWGKLQSHWKMFIVSTFGKDIFLWSAATVTWLKYCRYCVKH